MYCLLTHMLKLSISKGAGGGVLAHAHRGVAVINLTHFTFLAVVAEARICNKKKIYSYRN